MITQEMKSKIREYQNNHSNNFSDDLDMFNVLTTMTFTDETDLEFDLIDFFYEGALSMLISDMQLISEVSGYARGYTHGRVYLNRYVGWYAEVSKEKHPALHSSEAYELVLEKLVSACNVGASRNTGA